MCSDNDAKGHNEYWNGSKTNVLSGYFSRLRSSFDTL